MGMVRPIKKKSTYRCLYLNLSPYALVNGVSIHLWHDLSHPRINVEVGQLNLMQRNIHISLSDSKGNRDNFCAAVNVYTVNCFSVLCLVAAEILGKSLLQIWISNLLGTYAVRVGSKEVDRVWLWGATLMTDESRDMLFQGVTKGRMLHGRSCDILSSSLCTNLSLSLWTSVFGTTGIYVFFVSWLTWNIYISSVSSDITTIICCRESLERTQKGRLSSVPEDTCLLACGSWRHLGVLSTPW